MTTRLTTAGSAHGRPAQNLGVQIDDEGAGTSWQTSGNRVGRFARDLFPSERAALKRALTAANKAAGTATTADRVWKSEGATQHLNIEGLETLEFDPSERPPKGFTGILRVLRELQSELTDSPVAAIALEVAGSPLRAQLRHLGSEPLTVQLGTLILEVHLFGGDSALLNSTRLAIPGPPEPIEVGPGWTFELGPELGLPAPKPNQMMVARVEIRLDALGDGLLERAELSWLDER